MALTKTLTRDKCVSKMSRENVILTLIPPLMHVKGGIKYVMDLPLHLINVKGEVKHVNYFDHSFDARPYSMSGLIRLLYKDVKMERSTLYVTNFNMFNRLEAFSKT